MGDPGPKWGSIAGPRLPRCHKALRSTRLRLASLAPVMTTQNCIRHANTPATRLCDLCGDPLCPSCIVSEGLDLVCRKCANELQEKRAFKRIGMVVALTVLVGLGLGGAWLYEERARFLPEPEVVVPPRDYGAEGAAIRRHREALANDPCDKKTARLLADRLNRARAYDETIEFVPAWEAQCGPWPRLLWTQSYAHRKLRQWDETGAVITRIIEDDPDDGDYWWWRGRARAQAKDLDRAEADFRQSIANRSNGYAAMRLHEYLGDTNPCVAAFGIQHWMDYGSGAGDKAKRARTRRYLEGECAQLEGRGRVAIAIDDERAVPTEEVTVGATTGAFLLDERAAYVVLSEAFAQRAGIEAHAPVDPVLVLGGLLPASTGVAGTVKLGKATADHVAVAVVPELPGGIDGVVGQSFLWRFAIDTTPKGWTIRARR